MKTYTRVLLLSIVLFAPSCAMASGSPVSPGIVGSVRLPGAGFETADQMKGGISTLAVGQATVWSFLGIFSGGDSSIMAAASAGNIDKIHHIDYEVFNFLGIVASHKTIVYCEK
jgi:hypothetical protein